MFKICIISAIFTIMSISTALSFNQSEYSASLKRHLNNGYLTQKEVDNQSFQYKNDKRFRASFKNQVRSVASTLQGEREVIKLINPIIEIPIK